jgi:hypothetical protein
MRVLKDMYGSHLWASCLVLGYCLVFPSLSSSEETTPNLISNPGFESSTNTSTVPNWTATGDGYICNSCGPGGGNALKSGGEGATVKQSVDLFEEMTKGEINNGFEMTYGTDIWSHNSNATVPSCGSAGSGQDCKDAFSITLDIKDAAGTLLHKFEHIYEDQSWTGWDTSTFDFMQTIPSNSFSSAIATLELYGIDSGYTGGSLYGPRADNTFLTATYTPQAILDSINTAMEQTLDLLNQNTTQVTPTSTFEVTVNNSAGEAIQSFDVEVAETSEISITPRTMPNPMRQEAPPPEPEVEAQRTEVERELDAAPSQDQESDAPKPKAPAKGKVAKKIMKRMGDKGRYDATNQIRTLIVMQALGNSKKFFDPVSRLKDTPGFFTGKVLTDSVINGNNFAQYVLFGGSTVRHRALVDSQYK